MQYYDDLIVGSEDRSKPYLLSEENIIGFAQNWDPHDFHTDREAAARSVFAGLTAPGVQTICIANLLFHDIGPQAVLAGLAFEYQFPNPARAGDALTLVNKCTKKRLSQSRPDRGIIVQESRLLNQHEEEVLLMNSTVMMAVQKA